MESLFILLSRDLWLNADLVQVLQANIMYRYCRKILCTGTARKYYVNVLQGNIMYRYCREILCTDTAGKYYVQVLQGNM